MRMEEAREKLGDGKMKAEMDARRTLYTKATPLTFLLLFRSARSGEMEEA